MASALLLAGLAAFTLPFRVHGSLPALENLDQDIELELQDLLTGQTQISAERLPQSCQADVQRLCSSSQTDTVDIDVKCLEVQKASLSATCREDWVRALPSLCKADEAKLCNATATS
eukprot:TRINITY_DN24089_c0_g1_i2.p2 TRINITY_DN24089_c0_g1~~TRINITY_DN24089_c0_g1_i2.p2  ORF type:complete len:117 (+),score=21.13 TRINITY_DN24089_c0_g1_i2:52-402(+)